MPMFFFRVIVQLFVIAFSISVIWFMIWLVSELVSVFTFS
jgi:hypothetical protein